MGYYRQFENFDPLLGRVPDTPFSLLPAIAARARALLDRRDRDEIVHAAETADWFIDEYFDALKQDEMARLRREASAAYDAGFVKPWPPDEEFLGIPTKDNTSELEALKEAIGFYVLDESEGFANGAEFEYFAVLALWKLADAIKWLGWTLDGAIDGAAKALATPIKLTTLGELNPNPEGEESLRQQFTDAIQPLRPSISEDYLRASLAGEAALHAMDAVCWAEHLKAISRTEEEASRLRMDFVRLTNKVEDIAQKKAETRISVATSKAAIERNKENRAMKAQVFEWCDQHLSTFKSMDKAAEAIAGKLVPIVFRTARDWIGEYKKTRSPRTP